MAWSGPVDKVCIHIGIESINKDPSFLNTQNDMKQNNNYVFSFTHGARISVLKWHKWPVHLATSSASHTKWCHLAWVSNWTFRPFIPYPTAQHRNNCIVCWKAWNCTHCDMFTHLLNVSIFKNIMKKLVAKRLPFFCYSWFIRVSGGGGISCHIFLIIEPSSYRGPYSNCSAKITVTFLLLLNTCWRIL